MLDVELNYNNDMTNSIINKLYEDTELVYLYGDNDIFLNCCNEIDLYCKLNYFIYN